MNNIIQPITIKSIESVPRAIIFDDTNINRMLQEQSKEILRLSMNRTDGHRYDEVGRLLCIQNPNDYVDIYGSWDDTLKTCIIDVSNNDAYTEMVLSHKLNTLIFIHNHPNNSIISYNDIASILVDNALIGVIAVSNNGNISFALKNNTKNYNKLYMRIQEIIYKDWTDLHNISNEIDRIYNLMIESPEKFGLTIGKSIRGK
jgi:hypothetical protein